MSLSKYFYDKQVCGEVAEDAFPEFDVAYLRFMKRGRVKEVEKISNGKRTWYHVQYRRGQPVFTSYSITDPESISLDTSWSLRNLDKDHLLLDLLTGADAKKSFEERIRTISKSERRRRLRLYVEDNRV